MTLTKPILGILLFASFIIGWNVGGQGDVPKNVWPESDGGLMKLDKYVSSDKSKRLAIMLLTQKGMYQLRSE